MVGSGWWWLVWWRLVIVALGCCCSCFFCFCCLLLLFEGGLCTWFDIYIFDTEKGRLKGKMGLSVAHDLTRRRRGAPHVSPSQTSHYLFWLFLGNCVRGGGVERCRKWVSLVELCKMLVFKCSETKKKRVRNRFFGFNRRERMIFSDLILICDTVRCVSLSSSIWFVFVGICLIND